MKVENFSFKNGHNLKIVGEVWHPENPKGLAFVQHGLTSNRTRPYIQTMMKTFYDHGYTAVSFDTTHSWGESGGKLSGITLTSHWQDLEDVFDWAKKQHFYQEPFILAGHSLGAFSTLYLAQKHPKKIKAIIPTAAYLGGKLRTEAYEKHNPSELAGWKQNGYLEMQNKEDASLRERIPYGFMEDCLRYDVLKDADHITCPALLIVGELDEATPLEQQKLLQDKLGGPKELIVIPNCPHSFREPHELAILENAIRAWLPTI